MELPPWVRRHSHVPWVCLCVCVLLTGVFVVVPDWLIRCPGWLTSQLMDPVTPSRMGLQL